MDQIKLAHVKKEQQKKLGGKEELTPVVEIPRSHDPIPDKLNEVCKMVGKMTWLMLNLPKRGVRGALTTSLPQTLQI